jgi:hypothetical protein
VPDAIRESKPNAHTDAHGCYGFIRKSEADGKSKIKDEEQRSRNKKRVRDKEVMKDRRPPLSELFRNQNSSSMHVHQHGMSNCSHQQWKAREKLKSRAAVKNAELDASMTRFKELN